MENEIPEEYRIELSLEEAASRLEITVPDLVAKMESGEIRWMLPYPKECHDAIESVFTLNEAIDSGLTIGDLADAFENTLADGHDMLLISLMMTSKAIELAKCRLASVRAT